MDETKLQGIADSMAIVAADGYASQWWLDHSRAEELLKMIRGYVRKSAYKSDIYDPEDAEAEVICEVWRAFQKYGPRPNGESFLTLLKLKTNNVLTNRARKRFSKKNKLNYVAESLEALTMDPDNYAGQARIHRGSSYNIYELCCEDASVYNDCTSHEKGDTNMPLPTKYIRADEAEVGKTYITAKDKIVTVLSIDTSDSSSAGVRVIVGVTNREVDVPLHYPLLPYSGEDEDPVDDTTKRLSSTDAWKEEEDIVSDAQLGEEHIAEVNKSRAATLVISAAEVEAQLLDQVSAKEKPKEEQKTRNKKPPKKKEEIQKMQKTNAREGSAKQLIITLLKSGPQTRETLAQAISDVRKEAGSDAVTDIDKLKNYASFIMSSLKRNDAYNLEKTPAGWILK